MWLHLHFHRIQHSPLICVLLVLIFRHPCTLFILYINIVYMCMHPNPTRTKTQTVTFDGTYIFNMHAFHFIMCFCIPDLTPSHILGKKWNEMISTDYQQFIEIQRHFFCKWPALTTLLNSIGKYIFKY